MQASNIGSFEITKYRHEFINGQPKLVIEMVKVLNTDGEYIKFAKLKEVMPYLSKYPVRFKELRNAETLDLQM